MTVWSIVKWPVLALIVVLVVGLLYYATPNVQQPKFRWISVGAGVAILVWVLASVGFAFYVANFSSYNKTYGSLAGVIVTLLFLWITNLALLFGGELDAELERGRQLQAGIARRGGAPAPRRATPATSRRPARSGTRTSRWVARSAARRRRPTEQRGVEGLPEGDSMIIKRLPLLIAGGIGYVLGAKAGRERYEQMRGTFNKVKDDPRVQEKTQQATDLAKEKAPVVKDKLTEVAGAATDKVKSATSGPRTPSTSSTPTGSSSPTTPARRATCPERAQ